MKKRDKAWEGYFPQVLGALSNIMDFDYDIVHLSTLGERGNSSSWTGGIGLLSKGVWWRLSLLCKIICWFRVDFLRI
jgi:hypothetical protein